MEHAGSLTGQQARGVAKTNGKAAMFGGQDSQALEMDGASVCGLDLEYLMLSSSISLKILFIV